MGAGNATVTVRVLGDSKGLEQNLASIEGSVSGHLGKVNEKAKEAGGGLDGLNTKAENASKGTKRLGGGLATVAEGFAGVLIAEEVGRDFTSLEQATAQLGNAMRDAGEKQTPIFKKGLEDAQAAGEKLGFTTGDTTGALAKLRLAGIDTATGMKDLPTIMDLARAKNISLADATSAVVKGIQGSGKALKDLNVAMPPTLITTAHMASLQAASASTATAAGVAYQKYQAAVAAHGEASKQAATALAAYEGATAKARAASEKYTEAQKSAGDRTQNLGLVMDTLSHKVGGAAAASAQTMSGRMNVLKTEMVGAATQMVVGLAPAFGVVVNALGFLTDHMNVVLPILGILIGLFVAWKTAMLIADVIKAVTISIGAMGIALDFLAANPIVLVIAAIVALVAGLVLLITHVKPVQDVFLAVFGVIKTYVGTEIGIIVAVFNGLKDAFSAVLGWFGGIVGKVSGVFGGIADAIKNVFLAPFRFIADAWNNTLGNINFTIPGWVPGIGGDSFGFPKIPKFHSGGVVPGLPGTDILAVLRAGEHVSPASGARSNASGPGGGINITQHFTTQADPAMIARAVIMGVTTRSRRLMA